MCWRYTARWPEKARWEIAEQNKWYATEQEAQAALDLLVSRYGGTKYKLEEGE